MEYWLTYSPLPGMILWIFLYISDYYLTLYSAKGFREIGHIHFEKSFELTPQYQKDIDGLVKVSRRHIALLVVYTLVLLLLWWIFADLLYAGWIYSIYLGMSILMEVAVHLRHLRNVFMIRLVRAHGGIDGEVTYRQWFSYRVSANEMYLIALLYLFVAIITFSLFFLGGALMCFGLGVRHNYYAKKAIKALQNPELEKNANPS
jgi:hypothetical protein